MNLYMMLILIMMAIGFKVGSTTVKEVQEINAKRQAQFNQVFVGDQ